ncbi:glycosyltransferase [bacterium]|nr:glycosyltransferase [bacterium]
MKSVLSGVESAEQAEPVERELKFKLGKEAWQRLRSLCGGKAEPRVLEQTNIYFDSYDAYFACRRSMLRLRRENGRYFFVYKRGLNLQAGYFQAVEIEEEVGESAAAELRCGRIGELATTRVWRQAVEDGFRGELQAVGSVRNVREVWPISVFGLDGGEKLELDHTEFADGDEYELEIETVRPEYIKGKLSAELGLASPDCQEQKRTKYERFLRRQAAEKPVISCVMPVYNCLRTLKNAAASIQKQTFPLWELIAVDDGSDDGSADYIAELAASDKRIRLVRVEHGGITAALNEGLKHCRAPFIARMDGDDISHPERFRRQLLFLQEHGDVGAAGCRVHIFPRAGLTDGMRRYERWLNKACNPEILQRDIFVESPLVHPSVMLRAEALKKVGHYADGPWPEDYQLWFRFWIQGVKMAKLEDTLFYWRDTPQRLTRCDVRCGHEALRELKVSMFLSSYWGKADGSRYAVPAHKRRLIVWGAGPNGKALVKSLRSHGVAPDYFTDILEARHGQTICGLKVLSIYELPEPRDYFLLTAVGNPYSRAEIRAFLQERGWREGVDFCCMAGISD